MRALLLACAAALAACTTHMSVVANKLNHPVSTTRAFLGQDLRVLGAGDYQVVKSFSFKVRSWHMLGGAIPLGSEEKDISDELDAVVAENGGDAVANLRFLASDPTHFIPIGNFNYWPPFVILPSWMTMEVSGDVVKFREPGGQSAAAASGSR